MKLVKMGVLLYIMLSTVLVSYPQSMLISIIEGIEKSDVQVVDKIYKSKNKYLDVDVIIPQIQGLEKKDEQKQLNDKVTSWTEAWIKDVKEIADQYFKDGVAPMFPYQLYSRYIVTDIDSIVSFYIDYYQFTGGAHGITTRKAYTVDNLSGKELALKDLFKVGYDYKTVIDKEIRNNIDQNSEKYFTGKEGFNGIDDNTKFYLKDGDLVIYYGSYEIAPYASGLPEFYISSKAFQGNFIYGKI